MAERWLVSSGDIEIAARWNGGTLPATDDDLYANGFTGTITASRTALSWRTTAGTTAVAGGGFACSVAGVTIDGSVIAGTSVVLALSNATGTITVNGAVTGSASSGVSAITKVGAGGLFHSGSATGGSVSSSPAITVTVGAGTFSGTYTGGSGASASALFLVSATSHSVTGNAIGGSQASSHGVQFAATSGSLTFTGNATGGTSGSGVFVSGSASTCMITGDVTGGSLGGCGVLNFSTASVAVSGNATGGTLITSYGASNTGAGTLTIGGNAVGAAGGGIGAGVFGSLAGTTTVQTRQISPTGVIGVAGKVFVANLSTSTVQVMNSSLLRKTFYPSDFAGLLPAADDVRVGTLYNLTNTTGTLGVALTAADLRAALFHADDAGNKLRVSAAGAVELDPASLVRFVTEDTGETTAAAGSVAKLAQGSGGGGDATSANQAAILAAIQGSEVIQVASPNVSGNLVLTQGDNYDGIANPKASWNVTTDYTDGWSVALTIRGEDDAVIYTTTGEVVSATVVAVAIAAPTGLTMSGCPGQWQGKFDVQLTKAGSKKTIALGVCYINEDQTR